MTEAVLNLLCQTIGRHLLVKEKGRAQQNFIGLINVKVAVALI